MTGVVKLGSPVEWMELAVVKTIVFVEILAKLTVMIRLMSSLAQAQVGGVDWKY